MASIDPKTIISLLAAGRPPIVSISTDHRVIAEDWLRIAPIGEIGHMLEIVG